MSKIYIIASIFTCLAEQRLRGCKAWVERVMGECLKTLDLVFSTDHLPFLELLDTSGKIVGVVPTNPTEQS